MTELAHNTPQSILPPLERPISGNYDTPENSGDKPSDLELAITSINHDEAEVAVSGLKKFIKKFGLAEVVGTGTAVIAAYVAYKNGGDALYSAPTALAASTGETVGFYATSLGLEYRKRRKDDPSLSRTQALGNAATSEVKTYGPAEGVDFVTRPLAMWAAANIGLPGGVISETVAGKLIGDVPFFMSANHFLNAQERLTAVGAKPTFKNMLIDDKNRIASALTTKRSGRHAK